MRITGGSARGIRLVVPRSSLVRPTSDRVRGALFQVLGPAVQEARVLDLFAGTGALGLEALSRGAAWADFVERDPRLCKAIRQNLAATGFAERAHVYQARAEQALEFLSEGYGVVLLDPPYDLMELEPFLEGIATSGLVSSGSHVVVERRSGTVLAASCGPLVLVDLRKYGDTEVGFYVVQQEGEVRPSTPADAGPSGQETAEVGFEKAEQGFP